MSKRLIEQTTELMEAGKAEEAVKMLDNIPKQNIDEEMALSMGESYLKLGEDEKAYHILEEYPLWNDAYWRYCIGNASLNTKRWYEAYDHLNNCNPVGLGKEELEKLNESVSLVAEIAELDAIHVPFATRVRDFWELFLDFEGSLREKIGVGKPDNEAYEYMEKMLNSVFKKPDFRLEYENNHYRLSLSTGGHGPELYKLLYWNTQAPDILSENWEFYAGIPRIEDQDLIRLNVEGVWITPEDVEIWPIFRGDGRMNIDCYCDKCAHMEPVEFYPYLCTILFHCLGEICMLTNVCGVEILSEANREIPSVNLKDMRDYIEDCQQKGSLPEVNDPINIISSYELNSPRNEKKRREDIYSGNVPLAMIQLLENYSMKRNPFFFNDAMDGITWGYVYFSHENISEEGRVKFCEDLREELDEALSEEFGIGGCVGNANGYHYSYLDCISMDLPRFLEVVNRVMGPYFEMYQIEDCGFSEFRLDGQVFALNQEKVDINLEERINEACSEFEEGGKEGKQTKYILKKKLHGMFPVEDEIGDNFLYLPDWGLKISVDFKMVRDDFVMFDLKHFCEGWDRVVSIQMIGVGADFESAVDDAFSDYAHIIETDPIYGMFTDTPEEETSEFVGYEHKWDVYASQTEIRGEMGKIKALDFWRYFKEDVFRFIGDQKVIRVEFTVGKTSGEPIALCRISNALGSILQDEMDMLVSLWSGDINGVQNQTVILVQKDETRQVKEPLHMGQFNVKMATAIAMFRSRPYKEILPALEEMTEDPLLAREMIVYLPEICAQFNYIWGNYPESITLKIDGEEVVVNSSQIYYYSLMEQNISMLLEGNRIEILGKMMKDCVGYSKTKAKIEELGLLDQIHELPECGGDMKNLMQILGNLGEEKDTPIEVVLDTPEGFKIR